MIWEHIKVKCTWENTKVRVGIWESEKGKALIGWEHGKGELYVSGGGNW